MKNLYRPLPQQMILTVRVSGACYTPECFVYIIRISWVGQLMYTLVHPTRYPMLRQLSTWLTTTALYRFRGQVPLVVLESSTGLLPHPIAHNVKQLPQSTGTLQKNHAIYFQLVCQTSAERQKTGFVMVAYALPLVPEITHAH